MKAYLENFIARKKDEMKKLQERSDASQDIDEVRSIGDTLRTIREEIEEAEGKLAEVKDDDSNDKDSKRDLEPLVGLELRNGAVVGSFKGKEERSEDITESKEYRTAFMEYVCRNVPIPANLRTDENTLTPDVASVIPTHLVTQIIEKFDSVGMILPLVTRTSYKSGVEIPISTVKPVATWVAEGAGSDRQKKGTGKISFTYFKLRCEISMSMEVGTMALAAFESKFVENVGKAMVYAVEKAIISGTGSGQPIGILNYTAPEGLDQGQTDTGVLSFAKLAELEGMLPIEHETGTRWCMNKKTFALVQGLTDSNGQPVARVNYGIGGSLERAILGRDVVIAPYVEDGVMFMYDFSDYILNTIYDMGISKKQDWETEDLLTKAVMSVDGKPVDMGSFIKFTIDNTPTV